MSGRLVVLSTVETAADAERLARVLVEERLAACVNILPGVSSVFRWKGHVELASERLLVIKTRAERFDALCSVLVSQHPYELPEVVALPLADGYVPYLDWLDASVDPDAAP